MIEGISVEKEDPETSSFDSTMCDIAQLDSTNGASSGRAEDGPRSTGLSLFTGENPLNMAPTVDNLLHQAPDSTSIPDPTTTQFAFFNLRELKVPRAFPCLHDLIILSSLPATYALISARLSHASDPSVNEDERIVLSSKRREITCTSCLMLSADSCCHPGP